MMATVFGLSGLGVLSNPHGWAFGASRLATGGLLAAVWQGVLLSLVVGLGLKLLPRTPAAVRFAIWFGVFLAVAGLPLATLFAQAGASGAGGHAAWLTLDPRWCVAIAGLWAAASLVRVASLLLAALRVRSLWKRARPLGIEGSSFSHSTLGGEAVSDGAAGRRAQLCVSDEVDRPTVIGFFAPRILIPSWLVEKLTASELEQIVLHEAGHLGRADDWMNLLQKIALVVFPLNPALIWVERRLCFERELACDERVLKATCAPKAYAACLANLAEHRLGRGGLALALGALGRESQLGQRVGRILERRQLMRPTQARLVLGGALLGLLTAVAGLERCPQVIGFAPTGEMSAEVVPPNRVAVHAQDRFAYQAVVLRNNQQNMSYLQGKVNVPHRVNLRAKNTLDGERGTLGAFADRLRGQSSEPGLELRSLVGKNGSAFSTAHRTEVAQTDWANGSDPRAARQLVQWIVVTSWHGADGSRMVLTSATTTSVTIESSAVSSAVNSTATSDRSPVSSDSEPPVDRVHSYTAIPVRSYAALPMRDGWLVFQL